MAVTYWVGGTSGDMTVGANYAGGSVPNIGDDVIFNTGSRTVTVGPGKSLGNVICTSGWSGSFNNSGSPVAFTAITGTTGFKWSGSGDVCNVSFSGTCSVFTAQRGSVTLSGSGTISALYVENANVDVSITALTAYYGMTPSSRITIGTSGTAIGTESWSYGVVDITDRDVTACRIVGKNGRMYTRGAAAVTTAHVQDGAILNSNSSGTITTANVGGSGSLITPVNSQYNTSTITTLNVFSGASYVQYANGTQFSIGTLNVYGSQQAPGSVTPTV